MTTTMVSSTLAVAPSAASLADARSDVRHAVTGQIARALVDDCVQLTSELIVDAFVHGADRASVSVRVNSDGVRVDVTDGRDRSGTRSQSERGPTQPCADLLECLSSEWGIIASSSAHGRRTVWFDIPRVTCRAT